MCFSVRSNLHQYHQMGDYLDTFVKCYTIVTLSILVVLCFCMTIEDNHKNDDTCGLSFEEDKMDRMEEMYRESRNIKIAFFVANQICLWAMVLGIGFCADCQSPPTVVRNAVIDLQDLTDVILDLNKRLALPVHSDD